MGTESRRRPSARLALAVIALATLTAAACAPNGSGGTDDTLPVWQQQIADGWRQQFGQLGQTTTTGAGVTTTRAANPGGSASPTTTYVPPTKPQSGPSVGSLVKVSGTKLVDAGGSTVELRGVNRPGIEYACSQMNQFISDPYSAGAGGVNAGKSVAYADTAAAALLTWDKPGATGHAINTVRLPLNEECWLGINGAPAAYSGANYQAFIKRLVDDLTAQNIHVVLALHWGAPGSWLPGKDESGKSANGQNLAPNEDHSVTFWQQVATAYKGYGNVLFDLFTEPGVACNAGSGCPSSVLNGGYQAQDEWAWNLYLNGGDYTYNADNGDMYKSRIGQTFKVAGTQQLVDTIRAAGAANPIMVETLGFGNGFIDMMGTHLPKDPSGQIIASIHTYDFSGYNPGTTSNQTTLANQLKTGFGGTANITGKYPFVIGEYGTTGSCPSTDTDWVNNTMKWADSTGTGYIAWGWDQGEGCYGPSLVTNDDTGATTAYGAAVKAHLQSLQS
jgi:hypothetical protein